MQPRVSQSTACVAPDQKLSSGYDEATCQQIRSCVTPYQNSVTVLMKPRGSRLGPDQNSSTVQIEPRVRR
jgi:hypothetical protein